MNYIVRNKHFNINGKDYYIYLHSDHVIIHVKHFGLIRQYYQTKIDNIIHWGETSLLNNEDINLPKEIKNYCDKIVSNKVFW